MMLSGFRQARDIGVTDSFRLQSSSQRALPTKPEAPVTRIEPHEAITLMSPEDH
jgi:hypothetical protein